VINRKTADALGGHIGNIPDAKLGYVCDIWSPGRDKWDPQNDPYKLQMSLFAGVKKWAALGLQPERALPAATAPRRRIPKHGERQ